MLDSDTFRFLLRIGVAALAIYVIYELIWGRKADFVVRVKDGIVTYKGRIPLAQQPTLTRFLVQDLALHKPVTIMGSRNMKRLQLWFRGSLSDGEKQRIRNFFIGRV